MQPKHAVTRSTRMHVPSIKNMLMFAWLTIAPTVFLLTAARVV